MAMGFSSPDPLPFVSVLMKPLASLSNRSRRNSKSAARSARVLLTCSILEFQRHMVFINGFLPSGSAYRIWRAFILLSPRHAWLPAPAQQSAKPGRDDCAWFFLAPRRASTSPPPRDCPQSELPERPSHGTPPAACNAENQAERDSQSVTRVSCGQAHPRSPLVGAQHLSRLPRASRGPCLDSAPRLEETLPRKTDSR